MNHRRTIIGIINDGMLEAKLWDAGRSHKETAAWLLSAAMYLTHDIMNIAQREIADAKACAADVADRVKVCEMLGAAVYLAPQSALDSFEDCYETFKEVVRGILSPSVLPKDSVSELISFDDEKYQKVLIRAGSMQFATAGFFDRSEDWNCLHELIALIKSKFINPSTEHDQH